MRNAGWNQVACPLSSHCVPVDKARVGKKVVRSYKSVATIEVLTVFLEKAVAVCLYEEPYVQISSNEGHLEPESA